MKTLMLTKGLKGARGLLIASMPFLFIATLQAQPETKMVAREFNSAQIIKGHELPVSLAGSLRAGSRSRNTNTWWLHTGELDPVKASTPGASPSRNWRSVKVPFNLNRLDELDGVKVVWYRKLIRLQDVSGSPTLELGQISDRDKTYFNGKLIGSTGKWDANSTQAFDKVRLYHIPSALIRPNQDNVLLVRVQRFHGFHFGIHRGEIRLGNRDALTAAIYAREYLLYIFISFYAAVASFFLFLYAARTGDRENLYFGIFVVFLIIMLAMRGPLKYSLGLPLDFMKAIENIALLIFPISLWTYIRKTLGVPGNVMRRLDYWYFRFMLLVMTGFSIAVAVKMNAEFSFRLFFKYYVYLLIPIAVFIFTILIRNSLRGNRDARYILMGFFIFLMSALADILRAWGLFQIPTLIDFGFFFLVVSMAAILVKKYVLTMNRVEELNRDLEGKVRARTKQLEKTLARVRNLKKTQDGDYFLTSLLLEPLNHIVASGSNVQVEAVVRQKKRFTFRGKRHELGGDIVVADHIHLRGRDYVVFLNGDAMGKSMQGAGGALVLGAVFQAIIARTKMTTDAGNQYPEGWLKSCLIELQSVFISFDGSMLASAVFGLIEEETGTLYHVNVEHPGSVLYRGGRAAFLDGDSSLFKIGTRGVESNLRVYVEELEPGDILFFGSDGRDDLFLGYDDEGNRVINEDENLFLKSLEAAEGSLDILLGRLRSRGRFTDDLTLLRIAFREGETMRALNGPSHRDQAREHLQSARRHYQDGNPAGALASYEAAFRQGAHTKEAAHEYVRLLLRQGQYDPAAAKSEEFLEAFPREYKLLAYASAAHGNAGRLELAADMGERCRLRQPTYVWNLVNLTDVYRRLGKTARASRLLARVLKLAPDNQRARSLRAKLEPSETAAAL